MKASRLAESRRVTLFCNHRQEHVVPHGPAELPGRPLQLRVEPAQILQAVVLSSQEAEIGVLGGEVDPAIGLARANDRYLARRLRVGLAIVETEEVAVVSYTLIAPQPAQKIQIFRGVLVASFEILISLPETHLGIFEFVPPADDIDAKATIADVVNRRGHFRNNGWCNCRNGDRSVELNARCDGRAGRPINVNDLSE